MGAGDDAVVDALDDVWTSMAKLGAALSEAEWKTMTECPGWTVQDNLAHVIGIESLILGRPVPEGAPIDAAHIKNDVGQSNEVWVDSFRGHSGSEVLAAFRATTAERLAGLRALPDLSGETWTPVGPGSVRDLLGFRIFDSWVHEQDMRRALRQPGDWTGAPAGISLDRIVRLLPMIVGKKVKPPEGTVVVLEIGAPMPRTVAIGIREGRAHALDETPDAPTVRMVMDGDSFVRLATGRGDPEGIVRDAVTFTGDADLGRRVAQALNFLF